MKSVCSLNPLTTNDAIWRHLTLAVCYQLAQSILKISFAVSKRWDRGGGWVSAQSAIHVVAALAGSRKALFGAGWTISHLVSTKRLRNHSLPLWEHHFWICRQHSVRWSAHWSVSPDHNESLLMSGCGWGHEPKEIVSKKL